MVVKFRVGSFEFCDKVAPQAGEGTINILLPGFAARGKMAGDGYDLKRDLVGSAVLYPAILFCDDLEREVSYLVALVSGLGVHLVAVGLSKGSQISSGNFRHGDKIQAVPRPGIDLVTGSLGRPARH
jgi:hypothetical protein